VTRPQYFVTSVKVLDDHRLCLSFEDGSTGEVDLSDLVSRGGVYAPLRDPAYFRQARVDPEGGTIAWPNDTDVAPETLYARAHEGAAGRRVTRSA
jgi:dipeptidyl aminopeptidase/acylaminoacyl peptidase